MKLPNYVEVETSRYCNRMCEWCPNGLLKNRKQRDLLAWRLFEKVLVDLASHNYSGWLAFHNYNEPLANPRIISELIYANEVLPRAKKAIYTNGDKLSSALYSDLLNAEVGQIRVTLYPNEGEEQSANEERLYKWLERKKFLATRTWELATVRQGLGLISRGKVEMIIISPNIDGYYDRGGVIPWLSTKAREARCFLTSNSLSVDYLGDIKMCCNVVTGQQGHGQYVLGNVKDLDLIEVWNSPRFEEYRRLHLQANWSATPICITCKQQLKL
ncbi:MAG: radical SAM/SPASM domain-containing protein [Planctomycetaceae bacterium]|nr:radical SAM/SPASM domain-containing protein [Planctomycetaceae bacterium]